MPVKDTHKSYNMPLQQKQLKPVSEIKVETKCQKEVKIEEIIKDTMRKRQQEKNNKIKEEELRKESHENMKKKLEDMNEHIRLANLNKNERMKHKLKDDNGNPITTDGIPFNLIPWGVDQTQFHQETIDNRSSRSREERKATTPSPFRPSLRQKSRDSTSKSDNGIGMDFLEFQPRSKKNMKKRKHSYQNTSNTRHIEIEEKDSIEIKNNKVSYEQVKKTIIYNKHENKKISKDYSGPKTKKPNKHSQSVLKFKLAKSRPKSTLSNTHNRDSSIPNSKENQGFIEDKNTQRKIKQMKDFIKAKKYKNKIQK
jgi:hypothetical protein